MKTEPIKVVHLIGPTGLPKCPKCGQGHEAEGGSVHLGGSYEWGPFYWYCEDCNEQWGYA